MMPSIGFRNLVSLLPAIQATRLLTLTSVGFHPPLNTPAFAGHTTGRVHFEHPAFRLVSPQHPREWSTPHGAVRRPRGFLASHCDTAGSKGISVTRCCRLIVNHRSVSSFTSTPEARALPSAGIPRPQRSYGPLRLPGWPSSCDDVEGATFAIPGSPPITQITFPACRAHYPGGSNRCLSVSSLSARPSPVNGRVGIHNFTFEAFSSFTRVTACWVARPPKRRTLSRGFDPASYLTKPLGSYHVLPTTTRMDPPSIGDLRRWGAPLTGGWPDFFGSPVTESC